MLLDTLSPTALVMRGLIEGVPSEEYHAAPGTSKTGLDQLDRSPAHFLEYITSGNKETPARRFGQLFHRYILEPDLCRLAVWDGPARNTKAGKEAWSEFLEKHQGHEIVTAEEAATLEGMRKSVYAHPAARDLMDIPGRCELSRWNIEPNTDELCKVRPDKLLSLGFACDLKTCEDASPEGFAKSAARYRYHVQAAFYQDIGQMERDFPFIAVEKTAPFAVGVYRLSREDISAGRYFYLKGLERLAQCKISNSWPAYSEKIETLTLPAWAKKELPE
jgi:exodeoxyribonuclease VIII